MTRFIAIVAGKGGVGKTTTSINLGAALHHFGRNVIVLDSNFSAPHIALHLGATTLPVTLHDVLKQKNHISEAIYSHTSGLKIIPASISLSEYKQLNLKKFSEALQDLQGYSEIVLLDTSAGLGKESTTAIRESTDIILVTSPDAPSITDAIKMKKISEEMGKNVLGIIVNKARGIEKEITNQSIKTLIEKPILGIIPEDESVIEAMFMKNTLLQTHPNSKAAIEFKRIAAKLIGEAYEPKKEEKSKTKFKIFK